MDIRNELIQKAKEIGVKVSPQQAEQFQNYLDLLLERNEVVNLTAITDPHEAVVKHFVDSLTLLKAVEIKKGAKLVDVGTGAGFPGLPVKIMRPDIELTLLDSLNKRLIFLKDVCAAIGVEANCIHKRAEEAGRDVKLRESFDIATARAVANMNTLAEYCIPLIKMKGIFAAMKGPGLEEEMALAKRAVSALGCKVVKTAPFTLPDAEHSERNIAVMQKTAFTPKVYPRHGGTITKKPLFLEKPDVQ
ncbi:MAG: 16S rRNA (guanine(527)-N(7))-methyltransferase RsmG [Acutalibacteraceae bacterium]